MPSEPHCYTCRLWIASRYWNLHRASEKMIDEQVILKEVKQRRRHDVASEAHYHGFGDSCNQRCVK